MKLQFLTPLYDHPGPVASVYLDTSTDLGDPARAVELRWRRLQRRLLAHDADEPTVEAVEEAIDADSEVAGRHGRAIFATDGRLVLSERLPEPPVRDSARYGMLPDALPLALQRAPDIPYAAVVVHRVHAPRPHGPRVHGPRVHGPQAHGTEPGGAEDVLEVTYEPGRWPTSRVASARRSHHRTPVEDWRREAGRLLARLTDGVHTERPEVIGLSGDPWAVNSLIGLAPRHLHGHVVKLRDAHPRRPDPGRALLEEELGALFADRLSEHDRIQVDAYLGRRARDAGRVEGLAATVSALQRGQVRTLILNEPLSLPQPLWAGTAPTHLALSGEDLNAFGVADYWEEPAAGAALIRAAAGTHAELVVVRREDLDLADGLAVLLRYTPEAERRKHEA
ncbi:hypothetical protein J7E93_22130 [Streptomyces sp. ISL-36]|uniref:baeRF2 domain-containing protein n=1 Tax=Streptomyces sp. ISL-36 TaxID=2819182 RepID=UPI001BE75F0C|nr:hypothetical protein [Streptomyces sp. ISL-36]MBT2442759.1 hypothetical protein [Streptomyces sp. ISL-36]